MSGYRSGRPDDNDWDIAEPRADALIESLRAFGYSPETAIADLIDNSLAANASLVQVDFHWAGSESWVCVRDDGHGMSEPRLLEAMRPGSSSPLEERSQSDLGRFGLGLKTASFSQARELTVISKTAPAGVRAVRRWDLDAVAQAGEWRLMRSTPASVDQRAFTTERQGTCVLWTKCDRLVGLSNHSDVKGQQRFLAMVRRVTRHLAMTFHRFLSGRGKVRIQVNGVELAPWDPFLSNHPATASIGEERLQLHRGWTIVTPYVLPHRSKLSSSELEMGAGTAGWNQQQGFYIYRGHRLLVSGDWLNLGFTKDEHTKLARIAVDFPSTLDHDWQIDVKKSTARPPGALVEDLRRIAAAARRRAEDVYRHRGKIIAQRSARPFVLAWKEIKTRDGSRAYRLNRLNPVVSQVLSEVGQHRKSVEKLLRFVEETVPTTLIGVGIADALDNQPAPFGSTLREMRTMIEFVHARMVQNGMSPAEALEMLSASEPFSIYPEILTEFGEGLA